MVRVAIDKGFGEGLAKFRADKKKANLKATLTKPVKAKAAKKSK
jgi:hypothetical protein